MTVTAAGLAAKLSPEFTPRKRFQLTRRLVGVSRWPLILLTGAYAISVSDQYLLPSVFPFLKRSFNLSDTALGVLGSSYLIVVTLGTVPFGALADRFSRTKVIAWGSTVWGLAMLWTGVAGSYASLFLARTALGGASPAVVPTSQSLLADYYPVNQRSKVLGVYQIGQLIGFFLIPLGAAMATAWGWRSAFYIFAAPGFIVAILAWRLPEPARGAQDRRHQNLAETVEETNNAYTGMTSWQVYREILRVRTFTASMISSSVGSIFFGGIGVWTVTFLIRYHGLSVPQASSATSLFALGGLVGALSAGYVADYLNYAGYRAARVLVAGAARLIAFPLLYAAFSIGSTSAMLVLFTLGSMALIAAIPPLNAVRLDVLHPSLRGRGTALDTILQSLCSAASPVIFGFLSDRIGLRAAFLVLIPLLALAGIILLVFAQFTYTRDEQRVLDEVAAEAVSRGSSTDEGDEDGDGAGGAAAAAPEPPPTARDHLLVLEDIDFSYGAIQVLFETDLALPRGGCHALLGRNGVGKTTLLNAVAGLLDPQQGRIWYDGQEITGVPPEQRARLGITLVAGGRATFPSLSLRENLWLGAYPFVEDRALIAQRMDAVLEVFPQLQPRLRQSAGTLSGGEQQMMALGRALMAGPQLLLVDELSMGLAPVVTEVLLDVVRKIVLLGTTMIVVEQSVEAALRVADDVYFMDRTGIVFLGQASEVSRSDQLANLMISGQQTS